MWFYLLIFLSGVISAFFLYKFYDQSRRERMLNELDLKLTIKQNAKAKERNERLMKTRTFQILFYRQIDEMLNSCTCLLDMQVGIELLIGYGEQVDGYEIYQPLHGWAILQYDIQHFLYGLLHWLKIRKLLNKHGQVKQVDIIAELDLDKDKAGNFFYHLVNLGILEKEKIGRYNAYRLLSEDINADILKAGWPKLFGEMARYPIEK